MKKIITFLMIIGIFLSFNINVYAEGENPNPGSGTNEGGSENESGEETNTNASDATISDVRINDYYKVECTENNMCALVITNDDVESVKVTFKKGNPNATADPESGFTKDLEGEVTEFSVKVTSEDGNNQKTYNFKITKKQLSTDSTLKKLVVNNTEISLKEGEQKYKTTVSFSTRKVEIEAVPTNEKAKVKDFKDNKASFDFFENSKDFKIEVISEAGDKTTYTVTVTKRSEADVTLKSLTIKNYDIDFDSEVTEYELKVLKNVDKLDIKAVANSKNAEVKITNPKLNIGENEVKIEVSNDGNINTYIIKVTKLNEDDKTLANLKSLSIENYEIDFKPDKYEYNLKIENENYLSIKALPKMEDADVEITGNLDLEDGSIIKIKVIYDGEFYNVYKIKIAKEGSIISKNNISKKGVIAVIIFNIVAIITIGIVQVIGKFKNNKNNKNKDEEKETKSKRNKIELDVDDEIIDII